MSRRRATRRHGGSSRPSSSTGSSRGSAVLDDADPPFYKWFTGRQAERVLQLPGPPCARGPGRARRLPLARRGRRRSATSPTRELLAEVKRFANALKDLGVRAGRRRRDLPADDPRGGGRDARLRADRRPAQRRLRRLLRRRRCASGWSSPRRSVLITVDGAARKGKTAPVKDRVDEVMGDLADAREDRRRAQQGHAVPDAGGPRRLLRRDLRGRGDRSARPSRWTPSTRCTSSTPPARRPSRRASCTRPAAT